MSATQRFLEDCATKIDQLTATLGEERAIECVALDAASEVLGYPPSRDEFVETIEWISDYYQECWKPIVLDLDEELILEPYDDDEYFADLGIDNV